MLTHPRRGVGRGPAIGAFAVLAAVVVAVSTRAQTPVTVDITDFVALPITGSFAGGTGNPGVLARVNVMRPEPGGTGRAFVADLNGPLYILDTKTKALTTYLDFNGRGAATGLFDRLTFAAGFANGLISVQFDPDYTANGRFYTLHLEDPTVTGSLVPDAATVPGLNVSDYAPTDPVVTPGAVTRHDVLVEWTDTNPRNTTFEGTAREVLRVTLNGQIHPIGDMVFNPTARRGSAEWGVMYIGAGDGGAGEQRTAVRAHPQRLDTLVGKILRIVPSLKPEDGPARTRVSDNGRYRIPNDNPFVATPGARGEIWAYGLRNPHRLTWEVDPARPRDARLLAMSIGLHTWETVNIIRRAANFGYPATEGAEQLLETNATGPLPVGLKLPIRVSDTKTLGTVTPSYPVLAYHHAEGLAIMGGFVYRGSAVPALRGKFIFGDIPSGRLWYADYAAMLAADDGKAATMATKEPIRIRWDNPTDMPDAGPREFTSMNGVIVAAYESRKRQVGPTNVAPKPERADIRFGFDGTGEFYIMSKVDGMIRRVGGQAAN